MQVDHFKKLAIVKTTKLLEQCRGIQNGIRRCLDNVGEEASMACNAVQSMSDTDPSGTSWKFMKSMCTATSGAMSYFGKRHQGMCMLLSKNGDLTPNACVALGDR